MRRADYDILANTLASLDMRPSVKLRVVEAIADALHESYSNFDRQKFIEVAMGVRHG